MRVLVAFIADLVVNFGILIVSYPIWRELSYQRRPAAYWWHLYVWAAVLSTATLAALALAVYRITAQRSRTVTAIAQMIVGFLVLSVFSVVAGSSSPYAMSGWYPLEDITAEVFGGLQVLRFIPLCATSMAIISGLFLWVAVPRKTEANV